MSIRDSNVVIIEVGRTVVRAGLGLYDLLKTPTIVRAFGFAATRQPTRSSH
jgi:actin-related protein 9